MEHLTADYSDITDFEDGNLLDMPDEFRQYCSGIARKIMKILSVNVGLPRDAAWRGKVVTTGIFKEPVKAPVILRRLNLEGDLQADLTVHGGVSKAVYAYPSEHYDYWRTELQGVDLPWGMFGENFTTEGLLEENVYVGDKFGIGDAEVMATEPRMPCYKLGLKFGRDDIIKRFLASRRTGFYFAVSREGMVGAGDAMELVSREQEEISIADITRLYGFGRDDARTMRRAMAVEALPESWKDYFRHQLDKQTR